MAGNKKNHTLDEIKTILDLYLKGNFEALLTQLGIKKEKNKLNPEQYPGLVIRCLASFFQRLNKDPNNRIGHLIQISPLLQKQQDDEKEKRRKLLLEAAPSDWKSIILGIGHLDTSALHFNKLTYDNWFKKPIEFPGRFFKQQKSNNRIVETAASNFTTSNPLKRYEGHSYVLDATYSIHGNNVFIVAVGDGCGGHLMVKPSESISIEEAESENADFRREDKRISRAAHFGTKSISKLFAAYQDVSSLKDKMSALIDLASDEIRYKAQGERTTLLCARAFPVREGFRIIGFNIGDTALIAYHPKTKFASTLLPARVTISEHGQEATAQIPDQYKHNNPEFCETAEVDTVVPYNTILFPMTDGYLDYLPVLTEIKEYPNGLRYRETSIDPLKLQALFDKFSENSTLEQFSDTLTQHVFERTNEAREKMVEKAETSSETQIGDDMAMITMLLSETPRAERKGDGCRLL